MKCLKSYTVGEELILPAAIEMCTEMINEKVANQFKIFLFLILQSLDVYYLLVMI